MMNMKSSQCGLRPRCPKADGLLRESTRTRDGATTRPQRKRERHSLWLESCKAPPKQSRRHLSTYRQTLRRLQYNGHPAHDARSAVVEIGPREISCARCDDVRRGRSIRSDFGRFVRKELDASPVWASHCEREVWMSNRTSSPILTCCSRRRLSLAIARAVRFYLSM